MPSPTVPNPAARTLAFETLISDPRFEHLSGIAGIAVDLRYASSNNFVGRNLYAPLDCAWLHQDAAHALRQAVAWLGQAAPQLQLVVLDALRPHSVQESMWAALAGTGLQLYLADPQRGSIHSYGMAVDVTLLDADGCELPMGTGFDEMVEASHPRQEPEMLALGLLAPEHLANRALLREAMAQGGFVGINTEWWHFDCGDRDAVRRSHWRVA